MLPITAIVLTKNEERVIRRTVDSLAEFEQILIVDSASVDRTVKIALGAGAEVLQFSWNGEYPKKKQWALENDAVRNDWVLFVDADERPSSELINSLNEIVNEMAERRFAAYSIGLDYCFLGRRLRYGHRVRKVALVDRTRCAFPVVDDLQVTNMWEVEGHYQPAVDGRLGRLKGTLIHEDVDPLYDYFSRHNRYSDWEAQVGGSLDSVHAVQTRSRSGRLFHRLPAKPVVFFLYCYVLRRGFMDGRAGLHYAVAQAVYYWQIGLKVEEFVRSGMSQSGPG